MRKGKKRRKVDCLHPGSTVCASAIVGRRAAVAAARMVMSCIVAFVCLSMCD